MLGRSVIVFSLVLCYTSCMYVSTYVYIQMCAHMCPYIPVYVWNNLSFQSEKCGLNDIYQALILSHSRFISVTYQNHGSSRGGEGQLICQMMESGFLKGKDTLKP